MQRLPASPRLAAAALLAVATLAASAGGAVAAKPATGTVTTLADGLAGPLQIAVGPRQTVYVAESFAGTLRTINRSGTVSAPIAVNPTGEIGAVAVRGRTVAYTTNDRDPDTFEATASDLVVLTKGKETRRVDLLQYERDHNPDQVNTYGFDEISAECAAQLPPFLPAEYTGLIDTHAYALANAGRGWYVAEAGGNAILHVSKRGDVRTVAVLPPQPATITAEAAAAEGLPACIAGLTYAFEPVPTDVEVGADGFLYVTTLPGGPESPALGARGSVYRVNPATGATTRIATGFLGAVNLALAGDRIYVSELFAGRVSRVVAGGPQEVASLPSPAGLEWAAGRLYVSFDAFANGSVGTIRVN